MIRKLTEDQAKEIYALGKEDRLTSSEIGKIYGISGDTVQRIKTGKAWRHLELEPLLGIPHWKTKAMKSARQRILDSSKLNLVSGCWEWQNILCPNGYGQMLILKKRKMPHRVAYEEFVGPIPNGLFVCHRCDNPACCNPEHLFLGTQQDNMDDKVSKGRQSRGSKHCRAILTELDIPKILDMLNSGMFSANVGELFGVSGAIIRDIRLGRAWRHVTGFKSSRIQQDS